MPGPFLSVNVEIVPFIPIVTEPKLDLILRVTRVQIPDLSLDLCEQVSNVLDRAG